MSRCVLLPPAQDSSVDLATCHAADAHDALLMQKKQAIALISKTKRGQDRAAHHEEINRAQVIA